MVRVLWLTRKGEDTTGARGAVEAACAAAWPGCVVHDGAEAWRSLLPATAGRFPAYIGEVARGTRTDGPTYGVLVATDRLVGKASADIIEAARPFGRLCYLLDTGTGRWEGPVTGVDRLDGDYADATLKF